MRSQWTCAPTGSTQDHDCRTDRSPRHQARVTWLSTSSRGAAGAAGRGQRGPDEVARAQLARSRTLAQDPKAIVDQPQADIRSFTLTLEPELRAPSAGRARVRSSVSVTSLVDDFYAEVVQPLKPWAPPAPKPKAAPAPTEGAPSSVLSTTADASQVVEGAPAPAVTSRPELAPVPDWSGTATS